VNNKVAELEGAELDCWVAKAEGLDNPRIEAGFCFVNMRGDHGLGWYPTSWQPSDDWSQGGPIIEREGIKLLPPQADRSHWLAEIFQGTPHFGWAEAETPLIAAMRAFVASKFGDEVSNE
jgi:hypothetical protein